MAKITNNSDRVLHPAYLVPSSRTSAPVVKYLHLVGNAIPGVPPAVEERIGPDGHPLKGPDGKLLPPMVEYDIPDDVAMKLVAHKPNAPLFAIGLEITGLSDSKHSESKSEGKRK